MDEGEMRGIKYLAVAEKKLSESKGCLAIFFGRSERKVDIAIECFIRAAYAFKMAKKWGIAGDSFYKAGKLKLDGRSKHSGASNYAEAAACYKKSDPIKAVKCFEKAIKLYLEMGQFSTAASYHQKIAELCESETDLEKAIHHYEKVADYYRDEELNYSANKACLKVVQLTAQLKKSIQVHDDEDVDENSLIKYSAKEYYIRAASSDQVKDPGALGSKIFLDDTYKDFKILVQDQEIPVHKCVLSVKSPVLAAMLTSNLKESQTLQLKIEDFDSKIVEEAIGYFYTKMITPDSAKNSQVLSDLMRFGDKYDNRELINHCIQCMRENYEFFDKNTKRFLIKSVVSLGSDDILDEILRIFGYEFILPTQHNKFQPNYNPFNFL